MNPRVKRAPMDTSLHPMRGRIFEVGKPSDHEQVHRAEHIRKRGVEDRCANMDATTRGDPAGPLSRDSPLLLERTLEVRHQAPGSRHQPEVAEEASSVRRVPVLDLADD